MENRKIRLLIPITGEISEEYIQRIIDKLFFQLFDLNEDNIDSLLNKYYQF